MTARGNQSKHFSRPLPPEFACVAACCIWPPSPQRNEAIRKAAANVKDWNKFFQVVERQRVFGFVHDGLSRAHVEAPATVLLEIGKTAKEIAISNLKLAAEATRLRALLQASGISAKFVKGQTLAQLAFGSIALRHSKDIDLLVALEDVPTALTCLARAGYVRIRPSRELRTDVFQRILYFDRECELIRSHDAIQVELHWRLTTNPLLLQSEAYEAVRDVSVAHSITLPTLTDEALFAYLCVHGASNNWFRIKWLADIGAILSQRSPADIIRLYAAAESYGVGRCAAQAMLLSHQLFGSPVPDRLLRAFRKNAIVRWLCALALDVITYDDGRSQSSHPIVYGIRQRLSPFLLKSGARYRLRELSNKFYSLADIERLPLPPSMGFLYPFLRLPLWIARRLGPKASPDG